MPAMPRALARHRGGSRMGAGSSLPVWLRLLRAASDPLAGSLGPRIPLWARQSLHARLRRAGIDEELGPQQWVAVQLLLAAGCVAGLAFAPKGPAALSVGLLALVVQAAPWWWMRDAAGRMEREVLRELPFYLDVLVLALEAGGTLSVALRAATERTPDSVLRRAFDRVQVDIRAGRSRAEALRALADRVDVPTLVPVVAALIQADASGASLAGVLRAQAEQRLAERFNAAERRALEAPVKMLGPLVLCIFPCTFVVLAFPLVMRFLGE
jgi:tight adherence protein C